MVKVSIKYTAVKIAMLELVDDKGVVNELDIYLDGHKTVEQAQRIINKNYNGALVMSVQKVSERYELDDNIVKKYGTLIK